MCQRSKTAANIASVPIARAEEQVSLLAHIVRVWNIIAQCCETLMKRNAARTTRSPDGWRLDDRKERKDEQLALPCESIHQALDAAFF